jgi:hypothetical protein
MVNVNPHLISRAWHDHEGNGKGYMHHVATTTAVNPDRVPPEFGDHVSEVVPYGVRAWSFASLEGMRAFANRYSDYVIDQTIPPDGGGADRPVDGAGSA